MEGKNIKEFYPDTQVFSDTIWKRRNAVHGHLVRMNPERLSRQRIISANSSRPTMGYYLETKGYILQTRGPKVSKQINEISGNSTTFG